MKSLLSLNRYLYRYRHRLVLGVVWVILTNLFLIAAPKYIGVAIDDMKTAFELSVIFKNVAISVLLSGASGFFLFLLRRTLIITSRDIEYDLKNDIYLHLQSLSLSFFKKNSTGDLMARATNDLSAVRNYIGPSIMYSLNTVFRLLFALSAMIMISPMLTLYALLPAPILSYSVYRIGQHVHERTRILQQNYSDLTSRVQENLSGIRVVKAYTREESEVQRFSVLNDKYYHQNLSLSSLQATFQMLITGLIGLSVIIVIWAGGIKVVAHEITIGQIAEFLIYVGLLSWPMISIGWVTNMIQRAAAAQKRINEILEIKPEIIDTPNCDRTITTIKGDIEFRNVSFAYPANPDRLILKNISFQVPAGTKLAIVGATGSGKSTLVNLIPRLLDPASGEILIDGKSIKQLPLSILRQHIGFVPQDYFLFSDTIRDNITFGVREASPNQVETAARQAAIYEDIMDFPMQFDTMIGERGITLSGGQKQRTCIARALIRNPRILILDDSLSAVDTKTEDTILRQLDAATEGMTTIIISHRISTVKNCDQIIVLDDGQIVEQGSHDALLQRDGLYAELYSKQLLEDELSAME
ncbi:MAG: ABC transporter ATP-binding protein [Chlorobiales bacterium]|jgi:ATP-binding cassette, subfamily B, multidrug efflux pump|nr:ABC transporter ATP-binding protein [Chlorobiales bacterium]